MARPLVRLAERSPGPVRRSVLRLTLGAPRSAWERAALRTWRASRPLRQAVLPTRQRAPHGTGVVVVDATALDGPAVEAHTAAAAASHASERTHLLWLVSTPDLRPVTSRGWVADHVTPADVAERDARLALLGRVMPAARTVAAPTADDLDEAWRRLLRA